MRMIKIGLIAAAVSTAICVFLWFRDVRRIMLEQLSTVESAKSQLDSQKLNSDRAAWDPKAAKVLERSESIYRQSVCLYNAARKRLWTRFPAFVMGFDFISEDEFEPKPKKPQKEKYIGSVRFFKNLILAAVIIMIAIPTAFAVRFADKLHASEEYIHNQQKENEQLILNNEQLAEEVLMYAEEARLRSRTDLPLRDLAERLAQTSAL